MNRELFKGMGAWSEVLFLGFFAFIGYVTAVIVVTIASVLMSQDMHTPSVAFMRVSQIIAAMGVFLLPAIVFSYLFRDKPSQFLKVGNSVSPFIVGLALLLVIVVQPVVNVVGQLNEQMVFPEFLASVEDWMRANEQAAKSSVNLFFVDRSIKSFLLNIFVIAILAGIVEELFFRGCLQQIFGKIFANTHVAIWLTAFTFSAIHLQFYGFLPRLLLGAILGYLFVWSGSIWLPILAHVLNNAIIVTFMQLYLGTPQYDDIQNIGGENYIWVSILSLIGTYLVLFVIYRRNRKIKEHIH